MADDSLFLNFSVSEEVGPRVQKFTGGSWRERLKAKKRAQWRAGRGAEAGNGLVQEAESRHHGHWTQPDDFADPRPTKRRRENGLVSTTGKDPSVHGQQNGGAKPTAGPREVISSLFSYNPKPSRTSETRADEEGEEKPAAKPSNAPLVDGLDTFTSLGLSPPLATHLLTKMNLKAPTAIQKAAVSQMLKDENDAFIQSETGSGKTLAYLLPVVQRIMAMAEQLQEVDGEEAHDPALHRDSGLFAIILAPTRELCKQISLVLERLLGCAHYIVAGTVIGGEKKKSEKARLRKGLNILVATPGRLVDHLENTKVLDVSRVRWLILDEGDRLMDLGFEQDITKIVQTLDQKKKLSDRPGLPGKRTTVLCSATLKMNVQKLGEISLKDAVLIQADHQDAPAVDDPAATRTESTFLAPAQLKQSYLIVPAKLRLVTLVALLRRTFARKGSVMKAIVFVSCADSVEFHYKVLTRTSPKAPGHDRSGSDDSESDPEDVHHGRGRTVEHDSVAPAPIFSSANNPVILYKLHGSLPQTTRTSIVKNFASATVPSLLIATDVASRGLDLPNLDLVIEYDPAFSSDDHLHRIGRTARLGRDGRAVIFLLPGTEEGYVQVLKNSYRKSDSGDVSRNVTQSDSNDVLRKGFSATSGVVSSGSHKDWEAKATEFQLEVERWVLESPPNKELAKKAFQSHMRAYATHVAGERKWFDMKELHLGHLAKSFGLRDAPARMNVQGLGKRGTKGRKASVVEGKAGTAHAEIDDTAEGDEAARKMREKVRNRKMMMGGGADEFNIA